MSLVNQVLQDLQHRRSEHPATSGLSAAATVPRARTVSRGWLLGGAAVLAGLATFAVQQFMVTPPAPPVAPTTVAVVDEPLPQTDPMQSAPVADVPDDAPVETPPITADLAPADSMAADPPPATVVEAPVERTPEPLTRTLVTTTPQQRADAAYGAGVRALSEGRRGAATAQFRDALAHDASHTDARLALANVLAGSGELREAEAQLQQGLRIAPQAASLAERYARLLFERGDLAGAIGVLIGAAPPVESAVEYHALLAALQQRAGNHVAAAETYAALVGVRPEQGLWWMGLGISLEAEQRDAAAHAAYEHAARDARLSAQVAAFVRERLSVLEP